MRKCKTNRTRTVERRRGAAAVEFALVAPLLVTLMLGAADIGQAVGVSEVVTNASRAGARSACRAGTDDVSIAIAAVQSHLQDAYPNMDSGALAAACTVTVQDGAGSTLSSADLENMTPGAAVQVQVVLNFAAIRWIPGVDFMTGRSISRTTVMRRE